MTPLKFSMYFLQLLMFHCRWDQLDLSVFSLSMKLCDKWFSECRQFLLFLNLVCFRSSCEGRSIFIISIVEHPKNFKKEKENQREKCICTAWTLSWMFFLFSLNGHKFLLFSLVTKETFLQGMSVAFKRWSSTRKIIICDFPIVVQYLTIMWIKLA